MSFCPENVGNWSSLAQNEPEFSPLEDLYVSRAVSRFSRDPPVGKHRQHTFSIHGANRIEYNPRSKRKQQKLRRLILRRGRPISNIFWAKAHANVLKGTFSTDCKSDCVRVGLRLHLRPEPNEEILSENTIIWKARRAFRYLSQNDQFYCPVTDISSYFRCALCVFMVDVRFELTISTAQFLSTTPHVTHVAIRLFRKVG